MALLATLGISTSLYAEPRAARLSSSTGLRGLETSLDTKRAALAEKLDPAKVTPEQRSILVEAWLAETAPLERQIAEQKRAGHGPAKPQPVIPHIPIPADASPLNRDILEMENEILDFQNSLHEIQHSPEQRAIQIEAFLNINREALYHLEEMKKEAQRASHPAMQPTTPASQRGKNSSQAAAARQLETLLSHAETLSPEARATHLETHSLKFGKLIKEIENFNE